MNYNSDILTTPFFAGSDSTTKIAADSVLFNIPIEKLDFSVRFRHVLTQLKEDIKSLGDLINTKYERILTLRNCGIRSIDQARESILKFLDNYKEEEDTSICKKENEESREAIRSFPLLNISAAQMINENEKLDAPIQVLNLPKRFFSVINKKKKIVTIKDLLYLEPGLLLKERNLGKKTIEIIQREILSFLEFDNYNEEERFNNPILMINKCLERLPDRDLQICLERWKGKKVTSLESIGEKYGVTRERIRQVIERVIKNVKSNLGGELTNIRVILLDYLIKNPKPVGEKILHKLVTKFKYKRSLYIGILSELFPEAPFHGFLPKSFNQILAKEIKKNILFKKLVDVLENLSNTYKCTTSKNLIETLAVKRFKLSERLLCFKIILGSNRYFFFKDKGNYYLGKKGGIKELTYNILSGSEKPLNLEEIISILRKDFFVGQKYDSIASVVGNIKQDGRIIQLDRYLFGIEKHLSYPKEIWPKIYDRAKIFLEQKGKQTYVTEILDALRDNFPMLRSKYELVMILRNDPDIIDLGFFNFTLTSFGQQERIKVSDLIRSLFLKDSKIQHINEIKEKLMGTRYVHEMGLSSLLKGQDYLKSYSGGYFGLKNMEEENNIQLACEERFLWYLVNQYFFPHTEINTVAEYFDLEELQQKIISTITTSKLFHIYTFDNDMTCIIVKDWSVIKKTKCLLANLNEEVYEEQLLWMLKDIGVNVSDYKKDLYKIKNDRSISLLNNKYMYKNIETATPELITLLDDCYDFINDSSKSYNLQDMFELISSAENGIDYNQFVYALKEDERFIVMDNNLVLIK